MNKKFAMSALGYVIILVIILGIVMIISAPMMADKYKKNGNLSKIITANQNIRMKITKMTGIEITIMNLYLMITLQKMI